MKSFRTFLKESTKSLRGIFPNILQTIAKTGSSPAKISVFPAQKLGRRRKGIKVTINSPVNRDDVFGQYRHNEDDNTAEIDIASDTESKDHHSGILGHEIAHVHQTAAIISDRNGIIPNNSDRYDIPYTLRPNEIHARSIEAAVRGREHARSHLSDLFRNAKQGTPVPPIEDVRNLSRTNYYDILTDIGRMEDAEEEKPSRSFSKKKLMKKLKSRVGGGYRHGWDYAATPATLKSIRRKAEKTRTKAR